MSTFVANFDAAFYKLYIVDPSEQNIMVLSPANDGSGYPLKPVDRLPTDRPVDGITDLLIDGDIYVAENGGVGRVIPATSWDVDPPEDTQVRPDPDYTMLAAPDRPDGGPTKGVGPLYAFDEANDRIVAFDKGDGDYVEQYQLEDGGDRAWSGLRDFVVLPGADAEAPRPRGGSPTTGSTARSSSRPRAPRPDARRPSPTAKPAPRPDRKPTKTPRP